MDIIEDILAKPEETPIVIHNKYAHVVESIYILVRYGNNVNIKETLDEVLLTGESLGGIQNLIKPDGSILTSKLFCGKNGTICLSDSHEDNMTFEYRVGIADVAKYLDSINQWNKNSEFETLLGEELNKIQKMH